MQLRKFSIKAKCVADNAELYRNIASSLERGLPVLGQNDEHDGVCILVGSGPSVAGELDSIRKAKEAGHTIVALKDAHDWLIERGIVPDCAVAVDPQESRARCFTPRKDVAYMISSQCNPAAFDHLKGFNVNLWHLYIEKNQSVPPHGTPLIAGGTTTGLRSITLFYSMGFRKFELYGFDSCLKDGVLRMNGTLARTNDDTVNEIVVIVGGVERKFYCNPSMTAQANEFQNLYLVMPDAKIESHGDGLITAIIEARKERLPVTVSFIHRFGPKAASYRYRAAIPASHLEGASINDPSADVLVYAKPDGIDLMEVKKALAAGKRVIVDFCDDHFDRMHYRHMLRLADEVTCSTDEMAKRIKGLGRDAVVIADPYEFDEVAPHCAGDNLLWFGHGLNMPSLDRIRPQLQGYPLRVVSNTPDTIAWSMETMVEEFAKADIVILPASEKYKSANRAIEAIRQGCFVVAEPHPALEGFDRPYGDLGIWIGDIKEGIEWARQNQSEANQRTKLAQDYVSQTFAPRTLAFAWSRVIQGSKSTWEVDDANGTDG